MFSFIPKVHSPRGSNLLPGVNPTWGKAAGRAATGSLVRVTLTVYVSRYPQVTSASGDFLLVTLGLGPTLAVVRCLGISLRLFSSVRDSKTYFGRLLRYILAAGIFKFRRGPSYFLKDPIFSSLFTCSSCVGSSRRVSPGSSLLQRVFPFPAFVFS